MRNILKKLAQLSFIKTLNRFYTGKVLPKAKILVASKDFWFIVVILILGLTPLLWYRPDAMALGHDMGFPLDPQSWFNDRLYTWSERDTFGIDQSHMMASIVLHGFEYLLTILTGNVIVAQKFTYIFWFTLPGIAMYKFIITLLQRKDKRMMAFFSSLIYMFNLFLLQGWFIAERNKIAIFAALPIVIMLILKVIRDKYDYRKASIFISLIYLLLNGGGSIPLYGASILIIPAAIITFSISYIKGKKEIIRLLKFITFAGISFVLANAFWIFPLLISVRTAFETGVENVGGITSTLIWVGEISKEASFINLLRGQGFPDWGEKHVYGSIFINNLYLIIVSFIFLIFSFINLIWTKTKHEKTIYVFFLLSLVLTVFFAAGNHPPFGFVYEWLMQHVPMFIIFRTPFYKFAGGIIFVYSFMSGFAIVNSFKAFFSYIQNISSEKLQIWLQTNLKSMQVLAKTLMIIVILSYTYPFLTGTFFEWNKPISTMVEVPKYVSEYGEYVSADNNQFGRTLLIPDLSEGSSLDVTDWNYFSLNSVPSILTSRPHIGGNANTVSIDDKSALMEYVYESLEDNKNFETSKKLLGIIGVNKLLIRNDSISFENSIIEEPETWSPILERNVYLKNERIFDKWQLYSANTTPSIYGFDTSINLIGTSLAEFPEISSINKLSALELPNVFFSNELSGNSKLVKDLQAGNMPFREVLEMDFSEANVVNGKISFSLDAINKEYNITAKSFNSSELFYNVYLRENKDKTKTLTIERPQVELVVGEETYTTISKSQEVPLGTDTPLDIIVINETVLNVTDANSTEIEKTVGQFQPNSTQLSISYGSSDKKKLTNTVIYDPSFEFSRWGGAQICGGDIAPINVDASLVADSTDGDFSLKLETHGNTVACLIQDLEHLESSKIYRISFDYKNTDGFPLKMCLLKRVDIENKKEDMGCLLEKTFGRNNEWKTYTADFAPTAVAEYILHFYSEPTNSGSTINLIDNIQIVAIDMTPVGAFALNTGIESSQFFEVEENLYEELGTVHLNAKNDLQLYSKGAYDAPFIEESSFEQQLWGGVNLCGGDRDDHYINVAYSDDATDGERSARLEGQNASACLYNSVQNFRPSLVYKLSFDYKNISGNAAEFCALVQSETGDTCQPSVSLPKNREWQTYSTIIETDENSTGIIAHMYSPAINDGKSVNLFDNIQIEAAYNPLQKLFFISDIESGIDNAKADITVIKDSAVKYDVNINNLEEPRVLSINTAYHPLWTLTNTGNQNIIDRPVQYVKNFFSVLTTGELSTDEVHFTVNGFKNAWLVIESGEYTVEYFPQQVFIMGLFISGTYLSVLAGYTIKKSNIKLRFWKTKK